jgi:zinc protease
VTRWTDRVRREVLPNGLTVLVQREVSAPVAAVITHVKAGFFDEPDRWQGISHVLEHMFFKGTGRRGPGDIARETKAAGGYLNAGTGYDHTSYYVVLPASGLSAAIDIQSDALRNSQIDADELARELQVIIQEARRKLDSPAAVAHETLNELMFDRHRIRRWRIGHEETLAGFTRDDVLGYYRSRYVPGRTVVSIVGAVEEAAALEMVREAYGAWEGRTPSIEASPVEPPYVRVRTRTMRGDVVHTHLAIGWQAVAPLHPDAPALDLAAAVLGTGRGSWLYRSLREPGLATSISAHYYAPTELGIFGVSAECEPHRMEEVVTGMAADVRRLTDGGPSDDDLERARTLLLTRWARRLEPMDGRASALAEAEALKHVSYLDEEYAALASVTARQVREAAARYLRADNVSGLAYHPASAGNELDATSLSLAFGTNGRTISGTVPRIETTKYPAPAVKTGLIGEVHHVATDGADLLIRRKTGVPTVTLGIYAPRSGAEDPRLAGIGALGLRAGVRGAGSHDADALAFGFERLGGALGVSPVADWLGMTTTVLADRLADAAGLLKLVFTEPQLADEAIERERGLMIEEALQVADDMFRFPFQLAFREAFQETGYGLPVAGIPETLQQISAGAVREYYHREIAGRLLIVAVGDIEPAESAGLLAGVFGDSGSRSERSRPATQAWSARDGSGRVFQREKAQTAFAMAFPGPARNDRDRHAAEVWAAVASGLGGRLFESLRSRRSLAYTVLASSWQRGGAGALLTYIATAPEREDEARTEMLLELERFRREPVTVAELEQAINYLAGQAEVARQSAGSVLGEIVEAWLIGEGLGELEDPGRRYRSVTGEDVRRVAERFLDPAGRAEGVVRGRTSR